MKFPGKLGTGERVAFVDPPAAGPILGYSHRAVANLYAYARNNPTNWVDPSGLEEVGMHWISQSVFSKLGKNQIDAAAVRLFNDYTVPTGGLYNHNFDTWFPDGKRVTHREYNDAIQQWVDNVLKKGKITEQRAQEMIKMFTEKGFSGEAKVLYGLSDGSVDVIRRYRKGYFESIELASMFVEQGGESLKKTGMLKRLIRYAQITSKYGDDLEHIRQAVDEETYKAVVRISDAIKRSRSADVKKVVEFIRAQAQAAQGRTGWLTGLLAKRGGKVARLLGGAVGLIFLTRDAYAGATGQGHHPELTGLTGAADNAAYEAMFGPAVEGTVKAALESAGPFVNAPAPGLTRRGLQHGIEPLDASVVSGTNARISHERDVPDVVPQTNEGDNWFWRLFR